MNITQKKNLAGEILAAFRVANRANIETYLAVGDKLLASAALEGVSTSALCITVSREIRHEVSDATLRWCVLFAKTFTQPQRATLIETAPPIIRVQALCHTKYDGKRGEMLSNIKAGKRKWQTIEAPGQQRERELQRRIRHCIPADNSLHGVMHDPREVRIMVDDADSLQDGITRLVQRYGKATIIQCVSAAQERLSKTGESGLRLERIEIPA